MLTFSANHDHSKLFFTVFSISLMSAVLSTSIIVSRNRENNTNNQEFPIKSYHKIQCVRYTASEFDHSMQSKLCFFNSSTRRLRPALQSYISSKRRPLVLESVTETIQPHLSNANTPCITIHRCTWHAYREQMLFCIAL